MSKNDSYFNRLSKIKKAVTWDSSRKKEDKKRGIVHTLQDKKEQLSQIQERVELLSEELTSFKKQLRDKQFELEQRDGKIGTLNSKIIIFEAQIKHYKEMIINQENLRKELERTKSKLSAALEGLTYYSDGKHVTEGFMGVRVVDSGETATKLIRQITAKENSETPK